MNSEEYGCMRAVEDSHWWYRGLHALVLRALGRHATRRTRIVDIGCGTGGMAARLSGDVLRAALDFNPEAVGYCRARGIRRLLRGDASALPFSDGSADAVLMLDVLYHKNIAEPMAVLREVGRVLVPGGIVVLNVPAYQWLYSSHDVAVHTGRRFTRGEINGLLREAGFEVVESSYWNTALFPAICAVRLLRRWVPPGSSDVKAGSPLVNGMLGVVLAMERACMALFPLPFGVSIFVVAIRGSDSERDRGRTPGAQNNLHTQDV